MRLPLPHSLTLLWVDPRPVYHLNVNSWLAEHTCQACLGGEVARGSENDVHFLALNINHQGFTINNSIITVDSMVAASQPPRPRGARTAQRLRTQPLPTWLSVDL